MLCEAELDCAEVAIGPDSCFIDAAGAWTETEGEIGLVGASTVVLGTTEVVARSGLEIVTFRGLHEVFLVTFLVAAPFCTFFFCFEPLTDLRFRSGPAFAATVFFLFVPPGVVT